MRMRLEGAGRRRIPFGLLALDVHANFRLSKREPMRGRGRPLRTVQCRLEFVGEQYRKLVAKAKSDSLCAKERRLIHEEGVESGQNIVSHKYRLHLCMD